MRAAAAQGLSPAPGQTLHFAYGANMNRAVLAKREVRPLKSEPAVASASVELAFRHRGGYATLQQATASANLRTQSAIHAADCHAQGTAYGRACCLARPHGTLYLLQEHDLKKLAARETGYTLQDVTVTTYSGEDSWGEETQASAFHSRPSLMLPVAVPPPADYLELLIEGAQQNELDHSYIERLRVIQTAPPGGLPDEYFDTPSGIIAAVAMGAFLTAVGVAWWTFS